MSELGFAVLCGGEGDSPEELQGLMSINLLQRARLKEQSGQPLCYITYLEAAPWNVHIHAGFTSKRYQGVGTLMMLVAVLRSLEEGFGGRVGLHSLPQANGFYGETCGMTDLGPDPRCQDLRYFEMTQEQADNFNFLENGL